MSKWMTCWALIGFAMSGACGDDDGASDTGVTTDSGVTEDSGPADDTGTADDTGPADDAGIPVDAQPVLGCVDDPTLCGDEEMCCSGVPYPSEGICQAECPAVSDRNAKQRFESVDGDAVLDRLASMPVSEWSYNVEPGVRHMGPMAQDFREAFGLGETERMIHPTDANGVTIAAVQALYRRVLRLEEENRRLREARD